MKTLLAKVLARFGHHEAAIEILQEASGERFAGGVVVYDGETSIGFGERTDRFHRPSRRLRLHSPDICIGADS